MNKIIIERFALIIFISCVSFIMCGEICYSKAVFKISGENGAYSAAAYDYVRRNGNDYTFGIYKNRINGNYYYYTIGFMQPTSYNSINIKQIIIASDYDSVMINAPYKANRNIGIVKTLDLIDYEYDPGKVNRVLLSADYRLLIRIIDKNNYIYDFYLYEDFIKCCKKVAEWS